MIHNHQTRTTKRRLHSYGEMIRRPLFALLAAEDYSLYGSVESSDFCRRPPKGPTRLIGGCSMYITATFESLVPDHERPWLRAIESSPSIPHSLNYPIFCFTFSQKWTLITNSETK